VQSVGLEVRPSWITARRVLALIAVVFFVVNLVNAIHKGGDFDVYVDAAARLLRGTPLYADSGITVGFVGPPVQALIFVPLLPLAAAGPVVARLGWYAISLALLWYAVTRWTAALTREERITWFDTRGALTPSSRAAVWALAAVAFPLQTQFEHQNLNLILLASSGWAVSAWSRERFALAGAGVGLAAAIKVYPAMALAWLGLVRSWRTLGTAVLTMAVASLVPAVVMGWSRFLGDVEVWRAISSEGWPVRRANQSIVAMWGRYLLSDGPAGYPIVTWSDTTVMVCAAATALLLWAVLFLFTIRGKGQDRIPEQLAYVMAAASITSPVAWEHYFVAWFPVLLALRLLARQRSHAAASWTFWFGAVAITALSRPILGPYGAQVIRDLSLMTWGGLITCVSLAVLAGVRQKPAASGRP
jgi:alpha-1,2-mannosyltransferase